MWRSGGVLGAAASRGASLSSQCVCLGVCVRRTRCGGQHLPTMCRTHAGSRGRHTLYGAESDKGVHEAK